MLLSTVDIVPMYGLEKWCSLLFAATNNKLT